MLSASVLPDIDLLFRFLTHRGPTHSFITISVLMIPLFAIYRKKAIPYYAALLSHVLVGDFFTGGVELFWPLSHNLFGALNFDVTSLTISIMELVLFLITLPLMYKFGDLKTLFKPHNRNWALITPFGAVLGPLLRAGAGEESSLPILLVIPSLIYIGLFSYSMYLDLRAWQKKDKDKPPPRNISLTSLDNFSNSDSFLSMASKTELSTKSMDPALSFDHFSTTM